MRQPNVPSGRRLALFIFFTSNLTVAFSEVLHPDNRTTQVHLVCKKPESQLCVTWQLSLEVDPAAIVEQTPADTAQLCGLSDLKRILPHRKFITVESLTTRDAPKIILCKGFTKLKGDVVNWAQVEKALNKLSRSRRQAGPVPRGRYRGQTQSQYLSIDRGNGKDEGKAEAHSAADFSRASVSGNSGMGQAQSQSVYDPSCDDCNGKSEHEPESLKRGPYVPGHGSSGGNIYGPNGSMNGMPNRYSSDGSGRPVSSGGGGPISYQRPDQVISDGFSSGLTPGGSQNSNGGFRPDQQGSHRSYGPDQSSGPGAFNYKPTHGTSGTQIPLHQDSGVLSGNGGYRPGTGFGPGQVGGTSLGLFPGQSGSNVGGNAPVGNIDKGNFPTTMDGRSYSPVPSGTTNEANIRLGEGFVPRQNIGSNAPLGIVDKGSFPATVDGRNFGPVQSEPTNGANIPGQNGLPAGSYGLQQGGIPAGSGMYTPNQAPSTNTGYGIVQNGAPGNYNQGRGYGPLGNMPGDYGSKQGAQVPGQTEVPGSGTNLNKIGANWPLALGPYPGPPGSSVYCCIVPNGYGQNVVSGGTVLPSTNSGFPQYFNVGPYGPTTGNTPNNLLGPSYRSDGIGSSNGPANQRPYDTGSLISYGAGPVTGLGTYGTSNLGGPGGQNGLHGPGSYGTNASGGQHVPSPGTGYQNNMQGPGSYDTRTSSVPGAQNGVQGSLTYGTRIPGGSGGQYGMQGPETFGTGTVVAPGQNSIQSPGIYGTQTSGGPGSQSAIQGPGSQSGMQVPGSQSGIQGPGSQTGMMGPESQNGMQRPGIQSGTQGPGSQGGMQGPYITRTPGGPGGQNVMQRPETYGMGTSGGTGPSVAPGSQNNVRGPETYTPGTSGGSDMTSMQRPGSYDIGTSSGPGVQGQAGQGRPDPTVYRTGISGGPGGQNNMQVPESYAIGPSGGPPGGHNIMQGPGAYRPEFTGIPGNQIGMQGPGSYGTGPSGVPGGQNGIQGPGTYVTKSPGGQDVWTAGNVPYGTSNGQNVLLPNQGGVQSGPNGGTYGPGAYGGQIGNMMPDSRQASGYPSTQYPSGSASPGGLQYGVENTGVHGNQPQGSFAQGPGQYGFDAQGKPIHGGEYTGMPQNFVDPNSIAIDDDDSEAEASVSQAANGTTASASSKGGNQKGRAQTHVHGTYTGGGSFQAQAQITGENKEAESEVSGGKKGASSSASGSGRNNKSQANVQLGSETGSVQTQSQSNGAMHSSNSQVQGSVKGGMADAQAKGPGSTSSQAQIGFTPYKDGDKAHDLLKTPFVGGGIASAQSSGRTGQSQSQLHGTFKYGISYNGAAQAGASLNKDAVFPNRLSFDKIDVFNESDININVDAENPPTVTEYAETTKIPLAEVTLATDTKNQHEMTTEVINDETMKNSESRYSSHTHLDHHQSESASTLSPTLVDNRRSFQPDDKNNGADYEFTTDKDENHSEEYDTDPGYGVDGTPGVEQTEGEEYANYDEYRGDSPTHQSLQSPNRKGVEVQQSTGGNTQHIVLGSLKTHDAKITQRNSEKPDETKVYQPGERVPGTNGYRIPVGFTGSVKSVASKEQTYVVGSKHSPSQAQTVTLTPGSGKVKYIYPPSYGRYVNSKDLRSLQSQKPNDDRYVSVSKSVTRALDGEDNIRKQYSHTYYTKSSSCGYFTFTCTMVSDVNGRKKVCKPKIPTNPDGTPIKC